MHGLGSDAKHPGQDFDAIRPPQVPASSVSFLPRRLFSRLGPLAYNTSHLASGLQVVAGIAWRCLRATPSAHPPRTWRVAGGSSIASGADDHGHGAKQIECAAAEFPPRN